MIDKRLLTGQHLAIAILLLGCFLALIPHAALSHTPDRTITAATAPYPNCRYGSIALRNAVDSYDVGSLNLGWYVTEPIPSPPRPNSALPVHLVRLQGRDCSDPACPNPEYWSAATITPPLTDTGLGPIVDSNPRSIWLIGNEPDRPYVQDDVLPSQYAQAYHEAYAFIKARDPSAQVSAGGVVVPTPLRLQYLDLILEAYQDQYGAPMPVDLWNIHLHTVQEVRDSWGAEIPPGIEQDVGVVFTLAQHTDVSIFQQLVVDFRTWMAARGQRDRPLLITEFGVLIPPHYVDEQGQTFDPARVTVFMAQTMAWLDSQADPALGYPADNHRLVQRWNWYSLDDDSTLPGEPSLHAWNGWLFESASRDRSVFGDAFAAHTAVISPTVDLLAYRFRTSPPSPVAVAPGETATVTLQVEVANGGNAPIEQPVYVTFYEQVDDTFNPIGTVMLSPPLDGCGSTVTAELVWHDVGIGPHWVVVTPDPGNVIEEADERNNDTTGWLLVAGRQLHLPIVFRNWVPAAAR
jgi:hypothetical protein